MIILPKKRILLIVTCVVVSIFTYLLGANRNNEIIQTVSLPVTGKVVILDAGHGGEDEGAQSQNGTTEADTNLKIALKVQHLLEQAGCTVILTRSDENAIYDESAKTLKEMNKGKNWQHVYKII